MLLSCVFLPRVVLCLYFCFVLSVFVFSFPLSCRFIRFSGVVFWCPLCLPVVISRVVVLFCLSVLCLPLCTCLDLRCLVFCTTKRWAVGLWCALGNSRYIQCDRSCTAVERSSRMICCADCFCCVVLYLCVVVLYCLLCCVLLCAVVLCCDLLWWLFCGTASCRVVLCAG